MKQKTTLRFSYELEFNLICKSFFGDSQRCMVRPMLGARFCALMGEEHRKEVFCLNCVLLCS